MIVPDTILVMGVSGSGKSAVGAGLAERLGRRFVDADGLHPAENIARMATGTPLTDADRAPWLEAVAGVMAEGDVVVACSALRRVYRDTLRAAAPELALVFLHADPGLLADRMLARTHFMPTSLLTSQLATLEVPEPDEHPIDADAGPPVDQVVVDIAARLGHHPIRPTP